MIDAVQVPGVSPVRGLLFDAENTDAFAQTAAGLPCAGNSWEIS